MSQSFNFGITAGASQSSVKPSLKGNEIHQVKFDGAESTEFEGKQIAGKIYKVLKLKFSNDEGVFEHIIFEPEEKDFERQSREYTNDKGESTTITSPSNVENLMLLVKHLIDAVLPEFGAKIDSGEQVFGGKDWEQLRSNIVLVLEKAIDTETSIKLINDNKGVARFPGFFTGLNKDGKAYVRNNFIGKNLGFSSYETQRMNTQATAKPTSPESFDLVTPQNNEGIDLDFDIASL